MIITMHRLWYFVRIVEKYRDKMVGGGALISLDRYHIHQGYGETHADNYFEDIKSISITPDYHGVY